MIYVLSKHNGVQTRGKGGEGAPSALYASTRSLSPPFCRLGTRYKALQRNIAEMLRKGTRYARISGYKIGFLVSGTQSENGPKTMADWPAAQLPLATRSGGRILPYFVHRPPGWDCLSEATLRAVNLPGRRLVVLKWQQVGANIK